MRQDSGHTRSVWMREDATTDAEAFPRLDADADCDVCVVGAGMAGMSVAYQMVREGKRVIVLDDGPIAGGETSRTTAHLAAYQDDGLSALERAFGEAGARLAVESHAAAIDEIERVSREEEIDCDFVRVDAWLFLAAKDKIKYLNAEFAASQRAGLDVERRARVEGLVFDTGPAMRIGNQAQFDPAKYIEGLARVITARGGRIHTGTHAAEIKDGTPCTVKTAAGHTVRARDVVVCTNTPVNDWVTMHTKQAPYRTYVVGFEIPAGSVPAALYWDTGDPYHYVRVQRGPFAAEGEEDMLLVGGEDHKTGQAHDMDERFRCLEEWARHRFPMTGEVAFRWSGQVMEPTDYMGFIGKNPGNEHVFIATGDSGQGMTHGTIAGLLLHELVLGHAHPWTDLYSPARLPVENLKVVAEFAKENVNVVRQYADWLLPGEVENLARIEPGSGAVVRAGTKKMAVYRADDGELHMRSAVCPHLQCIVDWNPAEKSWDCPCHGSRFSATGRVLNGPANTDLAMIDPTDDEQARADKARDGESTRGHETERPIRRGSGIADMPREERREPEEAPGNKVHGDKLRDVEPGKDR
jgi:glycine/D-amino acid oxidase-like deaminating enzyme/nitrite reductase/ring-hydroxylating ferredoxin subunit